MAPAEVGVPAGETGAQGGSVELVWSPSPRRVERRAVTIDGAVTARRVLEALQSDPMVAALGVSQWQPGCWGRRTGWDDELPPDARVELYRALTVDPKEARRQRFQAQGPVGRFRRRTLER